MEKLLLKNLLGMKKDVPTRAIGLELEVEALNGSSLKFLPQVSTAWWSTKGEGSLRHGLEYVTKAPIPIDLQKPRRIRALTDKLEAARGHINETSFRTSTHVHVNCLDYTPTEIMTAATAYWLTENLLFKYYGKDRESNNFCLRLKDAEGLIKIVEKDVEQKTPFVSLDTDLIRYAGLNLNSLWKFGTIEFRGMRGTIDFQTIDEWSREAESLVHTSIETFKSPEEILDFYFFQGTDRLIDALYSQSFRLRFKKNPNREDLVDENAYRISKFCYSTDWEKFSKIPEPKKQRSATQRRTPFNTTAQFDQIWVNDIPEEILQPVRRQA
ncbi:MAG: hypothetical protein GF334_09185 [Candidatus Altiarchaeales archaeon]|nr:hypothetical protein [Candidatus Altiarchaeales archaeon]